METENNKIRTWGIKRIEEKSKIHIKIKTIILVLGIILLISLGLLVFEMLMWSAEFDRVKAMQEFKEYEMLEQSLKDQRKVHAVAFRETKLSDETIIRGIIGEAIGEPEQGIIAVTWVIRNRMEIGMPLGLSALDRKDLDSFISRQPQWKKDLVEDIWSKVKLGQIVDPTGGAKYFENVNAFGRPPWIDQVEFVISIGQHNFYK